MATYSSIFFVFSFVLGYSQFRASLVAQIVKRLPTMRETQVQSLGREDPLKKEMATHSVCVAEFFAVHLKAITTL